MTEASDQTARSAGVELSPQGLRAAFAENGELAEPVLAQPLDRSRNSTEQLLEFLRLLAQKSAPFDRLGIAMPGLISQSSGTVTYSAQMPEHSKSDLASLIKAETGYAALIENDANAAAYGEFRLGAGQGSRNLFYCTLGHGIGGAFILDGNIWRGASGFAGEFGYVAINSDGMRLEDVASIENIVRRTRNRFNRDHTSSLSRLDEQAITIDDIVSAARAGDDFAHLMLERTGMYVGTAISSVINLLNIEKIVIGGTIMRAADSILDAVRRRARELSFAPSYAATEIVAGTLGENASAVGAALIASDR